MRTLYDLLDVRSDADDEALSKAYRKAAKAHHPDLNAGDPDAPRRFKQIATAIEILRNPEQRAAYDRWLDRERQQERQRERQQSRLRRTRIIIADAIAAAVLILVLLGGYALIRPISTSSMVSEVENSAVPGPVAEAREQRTQRTEPTGGDEPGGEIERVVAVSALSKLLAEAEREAALAREQEGRRQAAEREATPGPEQEEPGQVAEHERQKVERRAAPMREQGRQEHNARPLGPQPAEAASPATPPSQPVQGAQTASSAASPRSLGPVEIAATRAFTRF